ncbi:glycine betaine--corrinoid protein methyltransferase [Acetobacterium tundrae]|uniref:Methyltransferase n=1 Tax=Acetobacterium tundrae TaxID=132932 RepID=A0ABR6WQA5_9FIRM|nr:glycine betaine--corrinoid protein methyltransferase [Acetobacterium tundrae]MBC3798521.1 glycine betaine--corrinoid protein methyltransferase [Acetobacterium tundrae]
MLPKFDILTNEEVNKIHENTMRILSEIGVEFEFEPAVEVLKKNGQKVDGNRVYFDRDFIEEMIEKAPSQFILHARNPENNLVVGDDSIIFMPGYGAPFIHTVDGERRDATMDDYNKIVKLAGASKNFQMTGGNVVEPTDIPDEIRHLEMSYSHIINSDKCYMGSSTGYERAMDTIKIAGILHGGMDVIKEKPALVCLINSLTPLKYDQRMLGALMAYAETGQAMVIASLVMAGSTGPATMAGALSLQNAEVLAGIVLAQCISPGTPVIYGSTSAITDMSSGALSIGNPEGSLFTSASAQLARFYGVPCRGGGGLTDAKITDGQAGYESMMVLLTTSLTGVHFVMHAAGILQYFMAMSYEKLMMDDEIAGMILRYLKGFDMSSDEKMAFDVIKKVGPGGHFLTQKHTRKNFKEEFFMPALSNRGAFDTWHDEKIEINQAAEKKWQKVLENYKAPELDANVKAKIEQFIEKRKSELI